MVSFGRYGCRRNILQERDNVKGCLCNRNRIRLRLVFEEDPTATTDGINLIRNYDLRYGFSLWGDDGEFGDLTEEEYDALPTEFYTKEINVVGDEYGFNLAITSENNELIIWDE